MQRIVLTGGPGAGKTSVLSQLAKFGYAVGSDGPRTIIQQRKRAGLSPRPDPKSFAEQVLELEVAAYHAFEQSPVFYERGVVEAVGMLLAVKAINVEKAIRLIHQHPYQAVFIFPPWEEIYQVDEERDHTFEHAANVYESTLRLYGMYDYQPIEVPQTSIAKRAEFIVQRTGLVLQHTP